LINDKNLGRGKNFARAHLKKPGEEEGRVIWKNSFAGDFKYSYLMRIPCRFFSLETLTR
jgi:hypothetical protein